MVQRRPPKGKPKDGKAVQWVARWKIPGRPPGSKTFTTQKAAADYERDQKRAVARGEWVDTAHAPTLKEIWADWEKAAVTDGTRAVRVRVGKQLGDLADMKITSIRPTHLRAWVDQIQHGRKWISKDDTGLAENTCAQFWGQLSGALHMAVTDNLLLVNPCTKVRGPRAKHDVNPAKFPSLDAITHAVATADDTGRKTLGTMILVGATAGMRPGEVAGLTWSHIDVKRQVIHVLVQAPADLKDDEVRWIDVKFQSQRTVPIPRALLTRLAEHRLAHPARDDEPMFRTPTGLMWNSPRLAPAVRALTGGAWSFHALRHVYASSLIRSGKSPVTTQTMLGHSSASTTLDIYTHVFPGELDAVRETSEGIFSELAGDGRGMDARRGGSGDGKSGTGSD